MKVEGMLSENEQELLYNLARESKGDIIEIGAYKGLSTTIFASGMFNNTIYSIDPHTDKAVLKVYKKNIRPYNNIVHIRKTSNKAWRDMFDRLHTFNVDLLFIDGDHSYDQCGIDYIRYSQFVRYEGIIVIHDVVPIGNLTGVFKFVYKFLTTNHSYKDVKLTDCTLSFRKIVGNTVLDRIKGHIIIMKILLYATAHKIKVPGWIRKIGTKIFNG